MGCSWDVHLSKELGKVEGSSRRKHRQQQPQHRREDVRAHAAARRWGYKAKLNKDLCEKETDPSCRL